MENARPDRRATGPRLRLIHGDRAVLARSLIKAVIRGDRRTLEAILAVLQRRGHLVVVPSDGERRETASSDRGSACGA